MHVKAKYVVVAGLWAAFFGAVAFATHERRKKNV